MNIDNNLQFGKHTLKKYNDELNAIRQRVFKMGQLVTQQLDDSVAALLAGDLEKTESVFTAEIKVNAIEVEIDEACTQILAIHNPAASDLRLVITVLKTITDLERIGDETNKIARMAIKISGHGNKPAYYSNLNHLVERVRKMLQDTLAVFEGIDATRALEIVKSDQQINKEYNDLTRLLVTHMMEDPRAIKHMLSITWCARSLERIGDHCKNISEYIIYLVKGKDIRHITLDKIRDD